MKILERKGRADVLPLKLVICKTTTNKSDGLSLNIGICASYKGGFKQFAAMCPDLCRSELKKSNVCNASSFYYEQLQDQHQSMIDNTQMTEITPYLYLGNEMDAKNVTKLAQMGIFHILNVTKNIPFYDLPSSTDQQSSSDSSASPSPSSSPTSSLCSTSSSSSSSGAESNTTTTTSKFVFKRISVNDSFNQSLKEYFDETFEFIGKTLKFKFLYFKKKLLFLLLIF